MPGAQRSARVAACLRSGPSTTAEVPHGPWHARPEGARAWAHRYARTAASSGTSLQTRFPVDQPRVKPDYGPALSGNTENREDGASLPEPNPGRPGREPWDAGPRARLPESQPTLFLQFARTEASSPSA